MTELYFTDSQWRTLKKKNEQLISKPGVTSSGFGVEYGGAGYYIEYTHEGNHYRLKALTVRALNALLTKCINQPMQTWEEL